MYRKTFVEIDTENLKHNVKTLISSYPEYKHNFGVVKGNVYGHGYESIKSMIDAGINYLAVSSLEEALHVRKHYSEIPILCLQPIHTEDIKTAIENKVTLTISNFEYFKKISSLDLEGLNVHLKINSGFNRLGVSSKWEVKEIVDDLKNNNKIRLEGIYSHFATTGVNDKYWDIQLEKFKESTSLINLNEIPIVHLGRSLTLLYHDKIVFCNGIRIGAIMYGIHRNRNDKKNTLKSLLIDYKNKIKHILQDISKTRTDPAISIKSAFSLYSEIIEIRTVKAGEFVGYGASFKPESDCVVGFMPIGYADGFMKKNVGGFATINGNKYEILAVDMGIVTLLLDESVKVYDKVELVGKSIPAIEVARRCNTTVYEILCLINENVPRILI